ncbi:hypothetical protein K440DRAFT_663074 [Wilcoxina mikolae CBS 423.85]|nr:hypothetical protein K440DRAFT_663074 [Wilcoxina mikolae CBS 423.85]
MPAITFSNTSLPPDVEIDILGDFYHIHSIILRSCSRFFDKSLSGTWWKDKNTHERSDGIRYCFTLKVDEELPNMSMVEPVPTGEDPLERPTPVLSQKSITQLRQSYATLFRLFHNKVCDDDFSYDLERYKDLVNLADQYCCLSAVATGIELLLIKWARPQGSVLAHQCVDVILLAIKIHSKDIYNDAYVHFVGQCSNSNNLVLSEKSRLPSTVREDAMEQILQLFILRTKVERLLTAFMSNMGERYAIQSDDARMRLGMVYKQMLFDNFEEKSPTGGEATLYRGVNQIVNSINYTSNYRGVFDSFKNTLKDLLKTNLILHRVEDFEHLTCASVGSRYPWNDSDDW